jgi:biopolymer transport protein ExbB
MSFNFAQILGHMGPLGMAIAGFLLLMGIACMGVVLDRFLALSRSDKESREFARSAGPLIEDRKLDELVVLSDKYKGSVLAKVLGGVARRYERSASSEGSLSAFDFARNEAERAKEVAGTDLRKGMNILATTGSVAPFVGLLGTVVGIIAAFQGIASSGSGGIGAISAGISEALIETALGLMIAIPAVLFFNYLSAKINGVEMSLARSTGEFLDELESYHGRKSERHYTAAA